MKSQKIKLYEIAEITSGYSFRKKIQNDPNGDTYAIQMRDISGDRTQIVDEPYKVDGSKINEKHLLQSGDILFIAKGANNFAVCYDEKYNPVVAASAFFVLRLRSNNVLPAYICLFINSEIGQNYLHSNMAGTYIPNINKSTLQEMGINIPLLENQEKLIKLYYSSIKEKRLLVNILEKKDIMINEMIKRIIKNK